MNSVYVIADNIVSPLGFNTSENFENLVLNNSGIKLVEDQNLFPTPFYASSINTDEIDSHFGEISSAGNYTRLEKMMILSIDNALQQSKINAHEKDSIIIISTTKGNIDLLKGYDNNIKNERVYLWKLSEQIKNHFNSPNEPIIISNACISGVLALIYASRLLQNSVYKNVIVTGGDIISEFVVSGFKSFHAISEGPCKPFDVARSGLSLGEGSGTLILSNDKKLTSNKDVISFCGGASTNDANHISGTSPSGEGLFLAIISTLNEAKNHSVNSIDYISAHGTATLYNDESEAQALSRAGLETVPVNSFKGFWGHTLGAAGIIESIAALHSMKKNILINSFGFDKLGVTKNINLIKGSRRKEINSCLKIASGFGGCNAAIAFNKL